MKNSIKRAGIIYTEELHSSKILEILGKMPKNKIEVDGNYVRIYASPKSEQYKDLMKEISHLGEIDVINGE